MKRSKLSIPLLIACVLLPALLLAGAGFWMLGKEKERWREGARQVDVWWLERVAENLNSEVTRLEADLRNNLRDATFDSPDERLMTLQRHHPLVRNVFRISESGIRQLPPLGMHTDEETARFLQRYASLFDGRVPWFKPAPDTGDTAPDSSYSRLKKSPALPEFMRKRWHWEDRESLLLYVRSPSGEVLGVEMESDALYARLDVFLRALARPGERLLLLDSSQRVLTASAETPANSEALLHALPSDFPAAALALYPATTLSNRALYTLALGMGLLLLLFVVGGTLGLGSSLQRSRRDALRKTTFVSNVSHEFKTPLTTLRLYSELLLEGRVEDETKRIRYLQVMRDESDRLARLVHNVLDFSRLELHRTRLQSETFDLCARLHPVCDILAERLQNAGMTLAPIDIPIRVTADPDACGQIVLNLCDNAIKYAAGGKRLHIHAKRRGPLWEIRFQDAGPGIPRKHRKRLFEAFHSVDERLTRAAGGTGLGLHISRRLAREMGGDLRLEDAASGCCFLWTLPSAPESDT